MAATQEQLREGFHKWLTENPEGIRERGRKHSQAHWPKEWEAAGYHWFAPPVCDDRSCPHKGRNMGRASDRTFPLDDGTSTIIITFICNPRDGHKPHYAFRSVAGEIANPLDVRRGKGGIYEIERGEKKIRTVPQASYTNVVEYQAKKHAANEERAKAERVEKYGPEIAAKWDTLSRGEKISETCQRRTPEERAQVGRNISEGQNQPEYKKARSDASTAMWRDRTADVRVAKGLRKLQGKTLWKLVAGVFLLLNQDATNVDVAAFLDKVHVRRTDGKRWLAVVEAQTVKNDFYELRTVIGVPGRTFGRKRVSPLRQ